MSEQAYAGLLERLHCPKLRGSMSPETHRYVCDMADTMGEAAEAISSLLKALEVIASDEYLLGPECRAIARAALNSDAPLSIGEGDRG